MSFRVAAKRRARTRDIVAVRVSDEMPFVVAASPSSRAARHSQDPTRLDRTHLHPLSERRACLLALRHEAPNVRGAVDGPLIANEITIALKAAIDGTA
jgi:hypothetical protein